MRLSTLFGRTLREAPAEAEHVGYQLLLRAGLVRQLQAGSFALLPLGMRALRRIEGILHEELVRAGGQEFRTPVVQSAEPWQRSGRYQAYGPLMLRLADRAGRELIFAPTHEEAVADLARREVESYRQLPALLYQIHTKYRDEVRAKGGLMRMREFTMLDAYSLDADDAGLDQAYARVAEAFERAFARCGVRFVAVEASAGEMGGREPREYMALSPAGEDTLAICARCGYAANVEVAQSARHTTYSDDENTTRSTQRAKPEEVATPGCATIAELAAFLGVPESATAKAVFFDTPERGVVFAVVRGDLEVNEAKLMAAAGVSRLAPASAGQIAAVGAAPGYASPVGLAIADERPTTNDQRPTTDDQHDGGAAHSSFVVRRSSQVFVVADPSVVAAGPLVAGANRAGYHLRNVLYGRDWRASLVADIAAVRAGDPCVRCGAPLALERGVEIGHIFKLGTRFAEALGATFLDEAGAARPIVMGSYGIGLERLLQVIIEQHHDAAGIIWPAAVAPLDVHLLRLGRGEAGRAAADALEAELEAAGLAVLYDDREESAGVKFNDADLIGLPVRLLISDRLLAEGMVELKPRGGAAEKVARGDVLPRIRRLL
ncbi:MAG TPA: proline--tRNA ligase [Roseiflexaceae bacterium]|nr:proline--tRNA ligase [Roseiflexaceae bacterium]